MVISEHKIACLLMFALLSLSCSERELYQAVQDTRESRCHELPSNQRAQCLADLSTVDYDEYRRELDKIQDAD